MLCSHNQGNQASAGFYRLDVYSLCDSMRALLGYLSNHQPGALDSALSAIRCFEPYGEDSQRYARATRMVPASCEQEVVDLLVDLRSRALSLNEDPEAGPALKVSGSGATGTSS